MSNWIKLAIRFVTGGCVEAFTGAVTEHVISDINKGHLAKLGVKAGGFLVGMYAGDKISDYIIDEIDEMTMDVLNDNGNEEEDEDG